MATASVPPYVAVALTDMSATFKKTDGITGRRITATDIHVGRRVRTARLVQRVCGMVVEVADEIRLDESAWGRRTHPFHYAWRVPPFPRRGVR